MRKIVFLFIVFLLFGLHACGQRPDGNFTAPIYVVKIFFADGTSIVTAPTGTSVSDWNTLINKPLLFPPALHNHNLLYKSINYIPSWSEITSKPILFSGNYIDLVGKPAEIDMATILPLLPYFELPQKTTAEINALTIPMDKIVEIWDKTLGVKKVYVKGIWKTYITNQ